MNGQKTFIWIFVFGEMYCENPRLRVVREQVPWENIDYPKIFPADIYKNLLVRYSNVCCATQSRIYHRDIKTGCWYKRGVRNVLDWSHRHNMDTIDINQKNHTHNKALQVTVFKKISFPLFLYIIFETPYCVLSYISSSKLSRGLVGGISYIAHLNVIWNIFIELMNCNINQR
jgi:hypothetical protein